MFDAILVAAIVAGQTGPDRTAGRLDPIIRQLPGRAAAIRGLDSLERQADSVMLRFPATGEALSDTVRAGVITVLATRFEGDAIRAALPPVARAWDRLFAGTAPAVVVEVTGARWSLDRSLTARYDADSRAVVTTSLRQWAGMAPALGTVLGELLLQRADSTLAGWLVAPPIVGDPGPGKDQLAYQLATIRGEASVACRGGDASRCRRALGFEPSSEKELSYSVRGVLLRRSLELGSPGGWTRLTSDPGRPLPDRLSAAAEQDVDQVFQGWLTDLRGVRRSWVEPGRWMAAIGWSLLALGVVIGVRVRR